MMKKVFVCITALAVCISTTAQVKPKPVKRATTKKETTAPAEEKIETISDAGNQIKPVDNSTPLTPKELAAYKAKLAKDNAKRKQELIAAGIKTRMDSLAYSIGVNISGSLLQQGLNNINTGILQKGLADGLKNKTIIDPQQCNSVIQTYMMELQQKSKAAATEKISQEKVNAAAFLEANKKRAGVITLPSGLQYEVLNKGNQTSAMPTPADTVVVHYLGTLADGTKFQSSYDSGTPLTIPVTGVIAGWTEILQLMHIGDKFKVFIPSELGYGDNGIGNGAIPGGAAIVFEMELMDIKPGATH
jgi:FKBP-type peptidyl-prolyl cis-trans isomerase FklB